MSWKEKLFTLMETRFVSKEKGIVIFISNDNHTYFDLSYGDDTITYTYVSGMGVFAFYELPMGTYCCKNMAENRGKLLASTDDEFNTWANENNTFTIKDRVTFIDANYIIGEPQVTTQQEI